MPKAPLLYLFLTVVFLQGINRNSRSLDGLRTHQLRCGDEDVEFLRMCDITAIATR